MATVFWQQLLSRAPWQAIRTTEMAAKKFLLRAEVLN